MLFVWISLWTIALILWAADWTRTSTRFAGAMAFAGGAGGLAATINGSGLLLTEQSIQLSALDVSHMLYLIEVGSSLFSQVGLPYFFLVFALTSAPFFQVGSRAVRYLAFCALIPPILMIYFTPKVPVYEYNFFMSLFWVGPYILAGTVILIYSWYRERNPLFKQARFFTNMITIVPVVFNFVTSNVLRSFELESYWQLNAVLVPIIFVLFIVFGIKYGVVGIKLRVERYRLDSAIRALTSGVSILNHSIKNELVKIEVLLERVKQNEQVQSQAGCRRDIGLVIDSLEHMNLMVERIHAQTREVVLKPERLAAREWLDKCLHKLETYYDPASITIRNELPADLELYCDRVHVAEVINNLLMNAIEAMSGGGQIRISHQVTKKEIILAVEDTGPGIPPEQLAQVLEPFFSTKNKKLNFGLGLSYCFQVMQKHEGFLNIYSEIGRGTTIFLHFPKRKPSR